MDAARAKKIRRIGFTIAGLLTLFLSGPMVYGAFVGASSGEIWDPITGERYVDPSETCLKEASVMIKQAASMQRRTVAWEDRWRQWVSQCRATHPETDRLLQLTRSEMKSQVSIPQAASKE